MTCDHDRAKREIDIWRLWHVIGTMSIPSGVREECDCVVLVEEREGKYRLPDADCEKCRGSGEVERTLLVQLANCPDCPTTMSLPLDGAGRPMMEVYDCIQCGGQCSWQGALCWRCAPVE